MYVVIWWSSDGKAGNQGYNFSFSDLKILDKEQNLEKKFILNNKNLYL